MSVIEELKTNPIVFGTEATNIDERYFSNNEDGTYSATPALLHNIIRDALNFYKEQVFQLDTECNYHTEKLAKFKDTWTEKLNRDQRELKYGEQLKELEKRKREWREANPDKCDTRSGGPALGDIDEKRFFAGYSPEIRPSLKQAVSLYKYLKEYDNEHGAEIKEAIPTMPDILFVKSEFADEYKALQDKWTEELGIPIETEKVGEIERTKYTINQLRNANMKAVISSDDGLDEYIKGLIKYITTSNKVEYKAKREECMTLIDRDFILDFNDSTKDLKAIEGINDSIEIYTERTDEATPVKFIYIGKEDAYDVDYKYILNAVIDGETLNYKKNITTKADLKKAVETSILLIESTAFNKYMKDLRAFADTL